MFSTVLDYFFKDNHHLSMLGILVFLFIAFIFSNNKRKINVRAMVGALGLQFLLAFFVLKTHIGQLSFAWLARGFTKLYGFSDPGIRFIFGNLIDDKAAWGFIFAVKVVPVIIFFGALMALLYYLGIVQIFVKILAFAIKPLLGTSGAETLCATANSFMGPTDSPLLVKKFLKNMTDSEMFVVMVSGMSTLAASVLAIYGSMGVPMQHLLAAAVMSVPGALLVSKIMIPETKIPETAAGSSFEMKSDSLNFLDAISVGTTDGLKLSVGVTAMLIAFLSLVAMIDAILLATVGYKLDMIFAKLFSSVAYFLGIIKEERAAAGALLGQKLVLNEFIAFISFVGQTFTERSKIILTYALAGFSNIAVIGILIGGVGALVPNKRGVLTRLGWRALLGGTLVNLINAAIAGLLI